MEEREAGPSLVDRAKLGVAVIAVGALLLFLLQNLQDAEIHFLWFEWTVPVIWALLASAAIGAAAAWALSTLRAWGRRREGAKT